MIEVNAIGLGKARLKIMTVRSTHGKVRIPGSISGWVSGLDSFYRHKFFNRPEARWSVRRRNSPAEVPAVRRKCPKAMLVAPVTMGKRLRSEQDATYPVGYTHTICKCSLASP